MTHLVSVVMSVYNAEPYLEDAIQSILGQTYQDFEFIIIDDGSSDRSAEIIKSFQDPRIVLLQQENHGLAYSLNRGIRESHGKYIGRMDADDISMSERLLLQIDFLNTHPEYVVIGSSAVIIDQKGQELYKVRMPVEHEELFSRLPYKPIFFHSSVMFLKSMFISCGGYNEKIFHFFEDQILWNQMGKKGKLHNISEPLIKYRLTPTSITNNKPGNTDFIHKIILRIISGEDLSVDELNSITKLKRGRSISQKNSDYYFYLGNIYHRILSERNLAKENYLSAFRQNPLNIKALLRLIQSLLPLPHKNSDYKGSPWVPLD